MKEKIYNEMAELFTGYLTEKKLRKTEERYMILKYICAFSGHFDMSELHQQLEDANFHVSKATLYNTLSVMEDAGLIVRHQVSTKIVQYELRILADTHLHLVCTRCGAIREERNDQFKAGLGNMKIARFTPEFYSLYIYGLCSKCKFKCRMEKMNK